MTKIAALTAENIQESVHAKLEGYKNLNVLEQYAMFMGKAQILEFGLKDCSQGCMEFHQKI